MSDSKHYMLSQDYERMLVLLEEGPLLGFVDFDHGSTLRDPVQIKRVTDGKYFEYRAGVRGIGYINAWGKDAKEKFVDQCRKYSLSYIVPNAEASMVHADEATCVSIPCPICGQHGHIGDCEGD